MAVAIMHFSIIASANLLHSLH